MNHNSTSLPRRLLSFAAMAVMGCLAGVTTADAQVTFQAHYGGNVHEHGRAGVVQLPNGRFLTVGESNSNSSTMDVYVMVTQVELPNVGNEWTYDIVGGEDYGTDIARTSDGNYIVTGYTSDPTNPSAMFDNIFLMKINSVTGAPIWCKTYGGTGRDEGYGVVQLSDGGYAVCGRSNSFGHGQDDGVVIRTDANGNPLWIRYYGGANNDNLFDIVVLADQSLGSTEDLAVTGASYSNPGPDADVFAMRLNSAPGAGGGIIWATTYPLPNGGLNEGSRCIRECSATGPNAGNLIIAGNYGSSDCYLFLIASANGAAVNATVHNVGSWDEMMGVFEDANGNFVATGLTNSPAGGFGSYDLYLTRVNAGLNLAGGFSVIAGTAASDQGWSVNQATSTNPGVENYSIITLGLTNTAGCGQVASPQLYLARFSQNGVLPGACRERSVTPTVTTPPLAAINLFMQDIRSAHFWSPSRSRRTWNRGCFCVQEPLNIRPEPQEESGFSLSHMTPVLIHSGLDSANLSISSVTDPAETQLQAYPNPVKRGTAVKLSIATMRDATMRLTVSNTAGYEVHSEVREHATGTNEVSLDTQDWPSGTYVVQVDTGKQKITQRVVVVD